MSRQQVLSDLNFAVGEIVMFINTTTMVRRQPTSSMNRNTGEVIIQLTDQIIKHHAEVDSPALPWLKEL
jgi:hypothetical protein